MNLDPFYEEQLATTASAQTINSLLKLAGEGQLVLQPAFQRNMVWSERQQALLIDSMLRGIPVPEIYLQTKTSADGEEEHIVVDGQQRISACLDFVAGKFPLLDAPESRPEWAGLRFRELDPDLRKKWRGFKFIVRDLSQDLEEHDVRAIFRRLNMTVESLEPQELRHAAYTGPFIKLVEETAGLEMFSSIGVFTARDFLRRASDEFISEVYFALYAKTLPNKKEDLDEAYAAFERHGFPKQDEANLVRRMGRVVDTLNPIATDIRKTRFRNKSDLYSLLFYLGSHAERLPGGDPFAAQVLTLLRQFTELIQAYRSAGDDDTALATVMADPLAEAASSYSKAVARAASDRGSRERRNLALGVVFGDLLEQQKPRTLTVQDEAWRLAAAPAEEGAEDTDLDEERQIAQSVIDRA